MIDGCRAHPACKLGSFAFICLLFLPLVDSHVTAGWPPDQRSVASPQPTQMPGNDRLAIPVLPESPTQVDTGRYLYYFHCMPCHGDRGQGLTDEWRQVWVEDHQNCWGRACHTGKSEMAAFYIPRSVPPVSGSPQALSSFRTPEDLFVYLLETQPPQRPGVLSEEEYWALTAFLLDGDGRLPPEARVPAGVSHSVSSSDVVMLTLVPLLALFSVLWLAKRRDKSPAS